ncbi:hypothetical protein IQ07DRAFT_529585 [Pyrenochaeta sp. DS3sAY3a]|nr:hypothetical protein IQ07DRAFT_529585 [Pyrenochaeta sp. DS3sAY3a]
MLKAQLLRRNFSLFTRVPYSRIVRSAARDGHETVHIHRVRIRKPLLSKSRLVGAFAIAGTTYGLVQHFGIEVTIEEVEEKHAPSTRSSDALNHEEADGTGREVDDDEEAEDEEALFFLPTGLSREKKPHTFYKGSDPEWQEFKKLSKDPARITKIKLRLVDLLRSSYQRSAAQTARLGKIDIKKGHVWLDIQFPSGPPVEWERPGIELTEDFEWRKATRPVEYAHHQRLNRILYPSIAWTALCQDTKRKTQSSWKEFRIYMGWDKKLEPDTATSAVQSAGVAFQPSRTGPIPTTTANATTLPTPTASDARQSPDSDPEARVSSTLKDMGFILPDPKSLTLDLTQFRQDFRKSYKHDINPYPRGSIIVRGRIDVCGSRARVVVDIIAAYDPKTERYVSFLRIKEDLVMVNSQHPRGGP